MVVFRQGELDFLCGAYAVVNAICACMPDNELNPDFSQKLFTTAFSTLAEWENFQDACWLGAKLTTVQRMVKACLTMNQVDSFTTSRPFRNNSAPTNEVFWKTLCSEFNEGQTMVAIQGIRKPHDHWIAFKLSRRGSVQIFDSQPEARRQSVVPSGRIWAGQNCPQGYTWKFIPKETILIQKRQSG